MDAKSIAGIVTRILLAVAGGFLLKMGWTDERVASWVDGTGEIITAGLLLVFTYAWAHKKVKDSKDELPPPTGLTILLALGLLFTGTGCLGMDKNADPFLVNAERVQGASLSTAELVWNIDNDNRQFMITKLPEVHAVIEDSRREFPARYFALNAALIQYRAIRDGTTQAGVNDALGAVEYWSGIIRKALVEMERNSLKKKEISHGYDYIRDRFALPLNRRADPRGSPGRYRLIAA